MPALSGGFDRVVSVMGNSPLHIGIFHRLLRYGGACIAHDSRMLGFYRHVAMGPGYRPGEPRTRPFGDGG